MKSSSSRISAESLLIENKIRYIHLVAFQKHTKELQLQAHAFKQGQVSWVCVRSRSSESGSASDA